jgi:hypothetical protein
MYKVLKFQGFDVYINQVSEVSGFQDSDIVVLRNQSFRLTNNLGFQASKFQGFKISRNHGFEAYSNKCFKVLKFLVWRNQILRV